MQKSSKEPKYIYTERDVAGKSKLAAEFLAERTRLNEITARSATEVVKRIYNVDHNTYLEGAIPSRYKELMGLSSSAVLRCDDCISYHVIQAYRLGCSKPEVQEAFDVALVVGGTIVVPHLRRAYELVEELYL